MQRIGLFGGAFNPVHLGHLLVAQAALEELELEKIFFIPAFQSPFKEEKAHAPAELRLQWLRLALAGCPQWEIDEQEVRRGGVSYTVDTIRNYAVRFPGARLFWIIGADNVSRLVEWREAAELAKLAEFVVIPRPGQAAPVFPKPFAGTTLKGFPAEISSSDIRARVKAGLPIELLTPPFVGQAIRDAGVFR